jgi:hypothetical protein
MFRSPSWSPTVGTGWLVRTLMAPSSPQRVAGKFHLVVFCAVIQRQQIGTTGKE